MPGVRGVRQTPSSEAPGGRNGNQSHCPEVAADDLALLER